ncbi:MFS transporter [Frankia sp. CNm7]|uniref:MFS transporter n=1 Tax=Frankia nepalensis TaxID=1836974 RepID=A0A937RMQ7_9ACTN|nr:MFS transporter [Frankia nepalensis]MBL7500928.1 MFS transporter [Frankia nepalensis]MBL7510097.1 MFS transporter [Frankia nepalensis]MBL7518435.1 MFS transporter [Frankia nepalensis]MBL7633297.1 MFS transporter [Frankia nepalensis]
MSARRATTSATAPVTGPSGSSSPRDGAIVVVLATLGTAMSLMQTLMVPLLPKLPTLVHTSSSNAFWAVTATLLVGAVANPVFGRLGDLFGKRRMLLLAIGIQTVGALIAALSSSIGPLVVGRALQGIGIAVIPLGVSIMRDLLPPKRMVSAMAVMSSSLGVGGALGLPLAALIAQSADWHALFWLSAVLGVVLGGLVARVVPESPVRGVGGFDVPGAILLSVGLVGVLLAVSKGAAWGWGSGRTLGLLVGGVLVLLAWGFLEARVDGPLIDLRTTASRPVLLTNLASVALGCSMYAQALIAPQLLQLPKVTGYGLGQSLLATGLWMAPAGLGMMLLSPLAGRLISARGPKTALMLGAAVVAGGYLLAFPLMGSPVGTVAFCLVISAGVGIAYAAMPTLIMRAVPAEQGAAANGLNTLMRSIGTSTAGAVLGLVMSSMTTTVGPAQVPSLGALQLGLLIGAGTALVSCAIAFFLPKHRADATPAPATVPAPRAEAPAALAPAAAAPVAVEAAAR